MQATATKSTAIVRVPLWGGPYDGSEITPLEPGPHVLKVPTGCRVHRYLVIEVCVCAEDGQPFMRLMGFHESLKRALGINVAGVFDDIDNS